MSSLARSFRKLKKMTASLFFIVPIASSRFVHRHNGFDELVGHAVVVGFKMLATRSVDFSTPFTSWS